ncbi:hypothetical protein [Pontibacillus marinus]|uniref:Uncharacterized protein n=1 Tax=Pontibacillus marinus BH030004 = DSM 16465 TaxID=1385511 RepID=A0A0A5G8Q0_9BACI|nr:hypothetical protein [Pontibacillus marinus]KGX89496.1 hypothetical protein N783_06365 [Pontibacillus marinus BH030004 = DSM 16465]
MKIKVTLRSLFMLLLGFGLFGAMVNEVVFGESAVSSQDEVVCESCWEFTYVDNQSNVFIDGKEEGDYLPVSSFIAESAAGEAYNHYRVTDVTETATTIESSSEVSRDISTNVSVLGVEGTTASTTIKGNNPTLNSMIQKHLEMNGFQATISSETTIQSGVSIVYTDDQAAQFFNGGDLTSLSSLSKTAKTEKFTSYAQAIRNGLNEYNTNKNVWLWDSSAVRDTPDETINFLTKHHVDNVYLHYNPLVEDSYPYFISKLTEQGIKVHALMGAPKWALESNLSIGKHRMDLVMEYNASVSQENAKFIGIHFDIEPHVLDEWDTDRAGTIQQWSNTSQEYISYAKQNGFMVGSDLPFWTDGKSVEPYYPGFYKEMIDRNDYVTVMAYRNTALGSNSITSLSENEVLYANSPKVEIGVELKPHYLDYVSFDNKTYLEMEQELSKVRSFYQKATGFNGITYHSFAEWKALEER